ncbi:M10 family metallopeptidase C-terminal domain-containing protein [Tritonibacter scottomollicae]|uniref:M10 family metallopeptidase C-terminal domain-containing protein n=1 Tax=Tritonibacter scottomollicae TaxID=483013 RepID=UPI003AA7D2CB
MASLNATDWDWIDITALPGSAPVVELAIFAAPSGGTTLVAASAAGGGLVSFELLGQGSASFASYCAYAPSQSGMSGMDLHQMNLGGSTSVMPLGPATGGGHGYLMQAGGGLAGGQSLDPEGALTGASVGRITASLVVQEGDGVQLITAGTSGLSSWQMAADTLTQQDHVTLPAAADQVSALALAHGDIVLSAQADNDSLQSYHLQADGSLVLRDSYGAADGIGIDAPTALATANQGADSYAILAAAGSDSLSVVRVGRDGSLTPVDHILDSASSHFQNVSEVVVTQSGDWTLVVAAGSDGGCSVFALLPGGLLSPLAHLPWSQNDSLTIRPVSGLAVQVLDNGLHVYASPEGGQGLYHLTLDLSGLGVVRSASAAGATLSGSAHDDVLTAGNSDQLLVGGAGEDTFVFAAAVADDSGALGAVQDFTPGADRLDLSGLPLLRSGDQLTLVQSGSDVVLHYEDYSLTLRGVRLQDLDLERDLMLELQRSAVNNTPDPGDTTLYGTAGDDVLEDDDDDGMLLGDDGNDRLLGQGGHDRLEGGRGADTLNGGDGDDTILGGDDALDLRDLIYAGAGNDVVDGGHGNDLIYGQAGDDTLDGGWGADEVIGQGGDDVLNGGVYSDLVYGGTGRDFVNGGFGHDRINGGAGADLFYHLGIADHGSDWIQDYSAAEGDVLLFGQSNVRPEQFQINYAHTADAAGERSGADDVAEAFVIYRPTGQIIWALVDGSGQDEITLRLAGIDYDLL